MTAIYSVMQFLYYMIIGATANFASVYLLDIGLTNMQIGILSAAACFVVIFLQPAVSSYADRDQSPSLKWIFAVLSAACAVTSGILWIAYGHSMAAGVFFYAILIILAQTLMPLLSALATESANQGKRINFGLGRGMGSLGFSFFCLTMGHLIARFGVRTYAPYLTIVAAGLTAVTMAFPFQKQKKNDHQNPENISAARPRRSDSSADMSAIGFLRRYRHFAFALLGCILIYVSHVYINNFEIQIVTAKGGNSAQLGNATALASLLELTVMVTFDYLLKWKNARFWFRISGIFFTLKCLFTLLVTSMGAFYAVQIFQPLGWGLMQVASVHYVNEIMNQGDTIKGQGYMTLTYSIGTLVGSLTGGALLDSLGVNGMLITAILSGGIGTAIVMAATGNHKST